MPRFTADTKLALGAVLYEIGYKRQEPPAPVIISRVYCGRTDYSGQEYHLFVEFRRWWNLTERGHAIGADDGLLVRNLSELDDSLKTWDEVCDWVAANRTGWQSRIELE